MRNKPKLCHPLLIQAAILRSGLHLPSVLLNKRGYARKQGCLEGIKASGAHVLTSELGYFSPGNLVQKRLGSDSALRKEHRAAAAGPVCQ